MDRGGCWQQEQVQHLDDDSDAATYDDGSQYGDSGQYDDQYGDSGQYGDGSDQYGDGGDGNGGQYGNQYGDQYGDGGQYGDQYGDGSGQYGDQNADGGMDDPGGSGNPGSGGGGTADSGYQALCDFHNWKGPCRKTYDEAYDDAVAHNNAKDGGKAGAAVFGPGACF